MSTHVHTHTIKKKLKSLYENFKYKEGEDLKLENIISAKDGLIIF